jgi:hypothetical protein
MDREPEDKLLGELLGQVDQAMPRLLSTGRNILERLGAGEDLHGMVDASQAKARLRHPLTPEEVLLIMCSNRALSWVSQQILREVHGDILRPGQRFKMRLDEAGWKRVMDETRNLIEHSTLLAKEYRDSTDTNS